MCHCYHKSSLKFKKTDLDPECFDVVGAVCPPCEVGQVELDLVPAVVQSHRHGADERLDARRALVVARTKSPTYVLVIQHLIIITIITRGQSNLTKSASRGAHFPVKGHPRGSKVVPLNSWGRVSY